MSLGRVTSRWIAAAPAFGWDLDKTVIVYRRSLEEAPASKEEIADAMEEGVVFNFLHNPVEIILKEGKVSAVKCEVMKLGEPDESGRKKPEGTGVFETYPCVTSLWRSAKIQMLISPSI
jgi:NADPH-dependent glutamate synthase beta subunit-like oxidoreductase